MQRGVVKSTSGVERLDDKSFMPAARQLALSSAKALANHREDRDSGDKKRSFGYAGSLPDRPYSASVMSISTAAQSLSCTRMIARDAVFGGIDLEADIFEQITRHFQIHRVVIDDQDAAPGMGWRISSSALCRRSSRFHSRCPSRPRDAPEPEHAANARRALRPALPPMSSAKRCVIASPRPVPPYLHAWSSCRPAQGVEQAR